MLGRDNNRPNETSYPGDGLQLHGVAMRNRGRMASILRIVVLALVTTGLVACGGGGRGRSKNVAPVANAGSAQGITVGTVVTLDGSASRDPNGDALRYQWTLSSVPAGSRASLSDRTAIRPAFTADTVGTYVATLVVNDGKLNSVPSTVNVTAVAANVAPVASAGPDQNVLVGALVMLDGSASTDANGDALRYQWTLTSVPAGSTATLNDPTAVKPTFTADRAGSYALSLVVSDGKLSSAVDAVTVTAAVANAAPVANAGLDQSVTVGTVVTLDGSASTDANGDALRYQWTLSSVPAGSGASLSGPTAVKPTFTPDVVGVYVASLVVNDGKVNSVADTVTVTAAAANAAPIANAGPDQNVISGTVVTLDGSASTDANGDALRYRWSLTSAPAGSRASLSDPTAIKPTFTADLDGTYVASLVVNDGKVSSSADTVTVTASAANSAPVANAGPDQGVYVATEVTLDGSASRDPDGDALTYSWAVSSYPGKSAPTLSGASTAAPKFQATDVGDYVFRLTVSDGSLSSPPDTVTVTVLNWVGPTPPGTELVVQSQANFFVILERTMTRYIDFSCGIAFSSIDRAPDATLIATSNSQLVDVNAQTGLCVARGNTPEWILRLAVSPGGQYYGVSFNRYPSAQGGGSARRLYRLSSSGAALSFVELSGATTSVNAVDFGPGGVLYGVTTDQAGQAWIVTIDPASGNTSLLTAITPGPDGDIDIDANGILRGVSVNNLIKFDLGTRTLISTTPIPGFDSSSSGLSPIVFVP